MGILILYFVIVLLVDSLIFWAFVEAVRDKEFSEGISIGESFVHITIATVLGIFVKMAGLPPVNLLYLFRPFKAANLNFLSEVICLLLLGAAEFGISFVMAKPLAAAIKALTT